MLIQSKIPIEVDIRSLPSDILVPADPTQDSIGESIALEDPRKDYGRTPGAKNIPAFLRNTIAIAAHKDKTNNVARAFGISSQEVSLIKHAKIPDGKDEFGKDRVNPNSEINQGIREAVNVELTEIRKEASIKLMAALKSVTNERIQGLAKLVDVMNVADGLSRIIERATPKVDPNIAEGAKFVFIIPENRKEMKDYDIIEVEQLLD